MRIKASNGLQRKQKLQNRSRDYAETTTLYYATAQHVQRVLPIGNILPFDDFDAKATNWVLQIQAEQGPLGSILLPSRYFPLLLAFSTCSTILRRGGHSSLQT